VDECIRDCEPRAVARGVRVELESAADVTLTLDKHKLKQAVGNLIDNAIDATPPGTRVEVTVARNGTRARVLVRDHGDGVPEAVRERLFTPFCTTKAHGIGLGLVLAKEIVEAHGGAIEWRDEDPGTEFVVTLPQRPPGSDDSP
jgi:signal transduction histidine kinase